MQTQIRIRIDPQHETSGLLLLPQDARYLYVFAHGAGAGMAHPSMSVVAEEFARRAVATLRYQFPYMERGSKRPDPPPLCHATVRAAVNEAARLAPGLPLFAGGRSFGGRMTSQAQALEALPDVRGLLFLAFPLHPAKQPSMERATHLTDVRIPMLFVQGTRDDLAELDLLRSVIHGHPRAQLHLLEHADHNFHAPAKSGRSDAQVREEAVEAALKWMASLCAV